MSVIEPLCGSGVLDVVCGYKVVHNRERKKRIAAHIHSSGSPSRGKGLLCGGVA